MQYLYTVMKYNTQVQYKQIESDAQNLSFLISCLSGTYEFFMQYKMHRCEL